MKQLLTLALALPLFVVAAAAQGTMLPDVELHTLDGDAVQLAAATEGKPTVVSFWASWCAPCKQELTAYSGEYEAWSEELGAEVLAVTIDEPRGLKKVPAMVESLGWTFPVLADRSMALPQALGFQSIPQVYVVDASGKVVYEHSGYAPGDEDKVAEVLASLAE